MKRVAVVWAIISAAPGAAWAQIPLAPAPDAPPPSAADPPQPGQAAPQPSPSAAEGAPPPSAPATTTAPGDQYYLDQAAPPGTVPAPFEPPIPGQQPFEPPPPPQTQHLAPRSALWLGARLGWFFPFGNAWARGVPATIDGSNYYYVFQGRRWRDYATSGPMLEIDAGVRLSRGYTAFLLWERAQTGSGDDESGPDGAQDGGDSDFWAIGLRANSNPNRLGFVTEIAVGYRRARSFFENGAEYQFTDAPFEARFGLGAEYRLNRSISISALATVGVGAFGTAERVGPSGELSSLTNRYDESDGHGWATLGVGAHFDVFPSSN